MNDPFRTAHLTSLATRTCADCKGTTGIIFALALVPLVMLMGIAADLSRTMSLQQKLQAAADNAATSASAAVVNNALDVTHAQAIALNVWNANVAGLTNVGAPTISVNTSGNLATATVSYSGSLNTSFSALMGRSTIPVSVTSTATNQPNGTTVQPTLYGSIWYDQYVFATTDPAEAFNNQTKATWGYHLSCPYTSQNWYNALSDQGLEVNVSCWSSTGAYDVQGYNDILDIAIVVEGHQIRMTQVPNATTAAGGWFGQITIDGTQYTNLGTWNQSTVYTLAGTDYTTQVLAYQPAPGTSATLFNNIRSFIAANGRPMYTVYTPHYSIYMNFVPNGGAGALAFVVTNPGYCGPPGGYWGRLVLGKQDPNLNDFVVSGPYATTAEYARTTCTPTAVVHLSQ